MKYCYKCPKCGAVGCVEWAEIANDKTKTFNCHSCKFTHAPPRPAQDPFAYVDQHDWPPEMETAVRSAKPNRCCVPNCARTPNTLDHRVAWDNGGKTSVDNLWPMCTKHNSEKNNDSWEAFLRRPPS